MGKTRLLGLLIFLLVAGVFVPALRHDFIYYDDPGFVTENPHVRDGLTWVNARWAFLSEGVDYWRPLSWLSHMADCQVFGLAPWGHHLTSILLHALNTLLVFVILRKMTGAVWRSLLVAALFGLHPLHVESVAWIAERKDVLSTLFWLLTIWAYAHWVRRREAQRRRAWVFYGMALAFFSLGLMSKPMLVTVPCVLLLLDFWPLKRFERIPQRVSLEISARPGGRERQRMGLESADHSLALAATSSASLLPPPAGPRSASLAAVAWSLVVEKIPFFVLAVAVGVLTVLAQKQVGALKTLTVFPWPDRISNALIAYCRYLGKCVFPTRLAVFYPNPPGQSLGAALLAGALLLGITVAVCALYRRRAYLLVGWLWFLGTLVPVIGLVQVGEQSMADRYSYVPLVGVFVMLAWAAGDVAARWPRRAGLLGALAGAIVAGCTGMACRQLGFWKDSTTLFRHALAVTEDNWAAHTYLGFALSKSPAHVSEAIAEYQAGLRIAPEVSEAHNYLAIALARIPGRESEAIAEFQSALRLNPRIADAHSNLATVLERTAGRLPDAIAEYEAALRLTPESAEIHYNLGLALAKTPGRLPEAITEFQAAVRLQPDSAEMHYNLARVLAETPALPEAITEYQTVLRIRPDYAEAHYGLGLVLARIPGHLPEAIAEYQAALRLRPGDAKAHNALGNAWSEMPDRLPEAVAEFQAALRLQPDFVEVHNNLGIALAQLPGRLSEAIAEYETVLRAKPDFAEAHFNLGNALAQVPGRLSDALAEFQATVRAQPEFAEAHNNLADALARTPGRTAEAIAEYEAAIRVKPDFFQAHYNLGLLLASLPGRQSEAIGHFESALQLNPGFTPARTMLQQLRAAP